MNDIYYFVGTIICYNMNVQFYSGVKILEAGSYGIETTFNKTGFVHIKTSFSARRHRVLAITNPIYKTQRLLL